MPEKNEIGVNSENKVDLIGYSLVAQILNCNSLILLPIEILGVKLKDMFATY